jgi:2,4-dienoyl-CoA reductase-like NADH-dependent reductase (Old Yellow Enzyme family)
MRPRLLFEPGSIGPVTTRNRLIKTANGTSFMEDDQTVGARMVAYYERLAGGGVGFLVVESCGVEYPLGTQHVHYHADGSYQGVQLHLDDDRFIEGFSRLTEAVHRHGCPVSIQLQHSGPWNPTGLLPRDPAVRDVKCASALGEDELPGPDFLPCRALTRAEIEDQVDLWASAGERAYKAGFDAVEMNHGTCHQGNTFLSRVWNRRDDEYGPQSLENRTRFLREIVAETKRRCGPAFAVHVLINIAEFNHPLATTIDEGAGMAVLIGEVADGINCRAERYGHRGGLLQPDRLFYPEPPVDLPAGLDWSRKGVGATVPLTEACKRAGVKVPVWTACRFDAELGEECLRRGSLDFVGMTRRLLADPDLPRKLMEGRDEDVRPCHGCLHCFDMRNRNKKLECRVNATLGRETDPEFTARPAASPRRVLVVGGGPAGMEAARVAAGRGHQVALYEMEDRLGGLLPLAAVVKDLETREMVDFVAYLKTQLEKEGVAVRLGQTVTPELVTRLRPDVLVVATGAAHVPFAVAVNGGRVVPTEKLHRMLKRALAVLTPGQINRLSRFWMPLSKRVVVAGGTLHGCELAEFLTKKGHHVVIAHDGPETELGDGMTVDDLDNLWPWLKQKGVTVWAPVEYLEVVKEGLVVRTLDSRTWVLDGRQILPTQDWAPDDASADALSPLVAETHVVGSARDPGLIVDAVREGARAGYAV